jgi:hypothetical protein
MANEFKIKNGLIVSGSADFEQDLRVRGTLTVDELHTSITSSSILYESGSTVFGNTLDDTHQLTGSVAITGSITLNGNPIGTGKLDETTFNSFTSSYTTGSFTGSFIGDGSQLTNIPASGVTGLNLNKIVSGSVSASISPNRGLEINTDTTISGSLQISGSGFLNSRRILTDLDTGSMGLINSIQFNTSSNISVKPGELAWNNTDGTLDLGLKGGNVVQQIGQEIFYEVRNETGIQIPNGTAVYANGVTAGSGRITVEPYTADGNVRENRFLGIVTENISTGVNGFVTYFGYVRGLDTRGTTASSIAVGDETWAVGDILYVHPTVAGKLTKVKPQHEVTTAIIITRHQSSGVIFVRPSSAGHLEDIHDISINTGSLTNGQVLVYNSTNGLWENTNTISGSLNVTGGLTATSFTGSINYNNLTDVPTLVSSSTQVTNYGFATTGSNLFKGTQTHSGSILPSVDNTYDLGSTEYQWRDVYISSGSLYIDGTKVLSSTAQELTITTDSGQSIKILESGTDSIILQTADGDIELKSNADGDILLDPTNGKIMLKGPVEIFNGNKIQSSVNGTPVVFASDIVVSGSIDITGTIEGIDLTSFSSSVNTRLGNLESAGGNLNTFTSSAINRLSAIETSTSSLNTFTNSINTTIKSKLNADGVISGSSQISLGMTNGYTTFSSSVATSVNDLSSSMNSLSSSFSSTDTSHNTRLTTIEGRYTTTGSNIFKGDQTITGSLYISQNLIVQGSSSLENITASAVSIGTNTIILNADTPAIRYAGISVFDSGSTNVTASLFYDSLTNNWKFQHSDVGTDDASILLYGPLGTGIDNAPTLVGNFLTKVEDNGHGHHLTTSSVFDNGTKISLKNNTEITGSLIITSTIVSQGTTLVSGSGQISYVGITNVPSGIVSGSSQVISLLPAGTVSGSSQVLNGSGVWSGSAQLPSGIVSGSSQVSFNGITDKPTLVSGSSQVSFTGLSNIPGGLVSGSSQIDLTATTNYSTGIKTRLNAEGVISGSSQVTGIANSQLTNSSFHVGTTSISLGRTSASQTLTGVSIDGNAATVTNGVYTTGDQTIAGTKTFSNRVVFNSAVANRPQFPGGMLGLDTSDGNFDIWGISRDYYPSHATAANAWGLRWNGDNNDFEFVGGGTNRVILDMDAGNITATGTISASNYSGTHSGTSSGTNTGDQTNISGNAATATTAGALSSMNISQFTNNSGYITGISFANVSSKPTTISGYGITDAITTGNIGSQSVSNAATVASLTPFQFFNNMGQNHSTQTDFNSISNFGFRFVQGSTNGPGTGSSQFYGFSIGLGNDYAYSDYALQLAIPRYPASDKYITFRTREATTWGSWNKISAGYADSAGSVSGANVSGNISGNASNITSYTINQSVGTGNAVQFSSVGVGVSPAVTLHARGSGEMVRFENTSSGTNEYTQLNFKAGTRNGYIWLGNQNTSSWAGAGGLNIYTENGHMDFWTTAVQRIRIQNDGHMVPFVSATYNLGSSSLRWNTVFTSDLSLSNGIGDYTIVEGEEKLYLYNNKNNKVYSFVLQEEDPTTATPKKS